MPALILGSQIASAGEYRGSLKDGPAVVEGYSWTGLYGGLNAQYLWDNYSWPGQNPYIAPPAPCGSCGPPDQDLSGAMFGGTIGYNYQIDRFVLGIEGDFDFGNITDAKRDGNYIVETSKIDDFATIRGRLGYSFGRLLVFGTGGVAFESLEYGESCPDAAAVPFGWCHTHGPYNLSKSQWNTGWVAGGGIEWAVADKISLKVEGLFADFGDNDYSLGSPLSTKKIENSDTVLKVGVNYHL